MSRCARTIALLAVLLPSAGATRITILPALTMTEATAARDSWLAETFGPDTAAAPVQVDGYSQLPGDKLQLLTSYNNLFFFMTGALGNMDIRTADGTHVHVHGTDAGIYFVGISSALAIGSIEWHSHDNFDLSGFGIPQEPAAAPDLPAGLAVMTGLSLLVSSRLAKNSTGPRVEKELGP